MIIPDTVWRTMKVSLNDTLGEKEGQNIRNSNLFTHPSESFISPPLQEIHRKTFVTLISDQHMTSYEMIWMYRHKILSCMGDH